MAQASSPLSIDPATTAFIVIDMQNDFLLPEGYFGRRGLPVQNLRQAVEPIRRLRQALPAALRVICTLQVYDPDGSDDLARVHTIKPAGLARPDSELPVRFGSWGAELISDLNSPGPTIVKRRFDAFHQTDLDMRLRCWGVKTVIIGGVVADVCVETTARSAYIRDFDVILASECVAGWQPDDAQRTATVIARHFGVSLTNDEIIDALKGIGP
jgi:ureidoacrylate peracid hydrolase